MERDSLGRLIRRLRDEKGMTQGQLAVKANVPREWLSLVETDAIKKPDRERLERIAVALETPPETLLAAAGYRVKPLPPQPRRTPEELLRELQAAIRRREEEMPI
jgi:transcriptional regulator with XRE-family HTH domain